MTMAGEEKILYRMISGKFNMHDPETGKRKTLRAGDTFYAQPSRVKAFLDIMEPVNPEEAQAIEEPETAFEPKISLKMIHRGAGRYVVINKETGEQINEGYLNKVEAEALVRGEVDLPEATTTEEEEEQEDEDDNTTPTTSTVEGSGGVPSRRRARVKPSRPEPDTE